MSATLASSGPAVQPVATTETLPEAVDIAIIGGGIVGVSTALWLARRGVSVALFEKGRIAAEQSSRNWGWVRVAGRDLRELPLMQRSATLWQEMTRTVEAETGYRRAGIVYAQKTEQARGRHSRWAEHARALGIQVTLLSANEVAARTPGLTRSCFGALYTPDDGRAEPQMAVPAMADAAIRAGAHLLQHCAVRSIDMSAGRVSGVVTEQGRVRASTVIVAGGSWSRLLLSGVGTTLPQLKVLSTAYRTGPLDAGIDSAMSFSEFALRKRLDGGYTIASSAISAAEIVPDSIRFFRQFLPAYLMERKGMRLRLGRAFIDEALNWHPGSPDKRSIYEAVRILDPKPDLQTVAKVQASIAAALPSFAGVPIVQSWAGMIDTTPDAIPVISRLDAVPGLIIGTGFAGHGFGIGPGAGELLADMATGTTSAVDPSAFRFSRFTEGSKLDLQAWL
ncbi:MAG: FAD-binding oxidoreductase [Sphingomonadales bacterium]|nr:MAG: FAD-binding oxidoreductase [Sphingomonadales bacterium]